MIVYLVRHAEAFEAKEGLTDECRWLTKKGRKSVSGLFRKISGYDGKPRRIISSPLVRAVQTAETLLSDAGSGCEVVVNPLLAPGGDTERLAEFLERNDSTKPLVLVGHEPQMGALVSRLLGRTEPVGLKKGACVALSLRKGKSGKGAVFLWYLVPGEKPVDSFKKAFGGK